MKYTAAALLSILSGCASGPLPWAQGPRLSESACTASCTQHFEQCPRVFAAFPERGAVECPAEQRLCLKSCETDRDGPAAAASPLPRTPSPRSDVPTKEARLRELKYLYDQGLVSDDVYRDRQRAILSEP